MAILAAALVVGVAGDLLLREVPWGLNAGLWTLLLALIAGGLALRLGTRPATPAVVLLAGAVLFASALAWRDSTTLAVLNVLAALTCISLAPVGRPAFRLAAAGLGEYARQGRGLVAAMVAGATVPAAEVRWEELSRGRWRGRVGPAARGLAIAVPLVLVFGGLFVAADAVFESLVAGLFDTEELLRHAGLIVLFGWIAAGMLRHLLGSDLLGPAAAGGGRASRLGTTETAVALGALNVLFLGFVLVQLRYLFGGEELVREATGLTYAEYARRGFFELSAVAGLVVPLLLVWDRLLRPEPRALRVFRSLAALLGLLLLVVMASALQRMRLYQEAYGLTELRLYTTAFMLWLGVVLVWLALTVLRGRRPRFAAGAVAAGLLTVLVLDAVNPDALIARTNVARGGEGGRIDVRYLRMLSDDATPQLVRRLGALERSGEPRALAALAEDLLLRAGSDDWRSWNLGRSRARAAIETHRARLEALAARGSGA